MKFKTALASLLFLSAPAYAGDRPVVLELFTSQGCSSCPPADALLQSLAKDPHILALSLHVTYWDYLGWKDPFASIPNTNRQRNYVRILNARGLYTPQMVVDGRFSVVGSSRGEVTQALEQAMDGQITVPIKVTAEGHNFHIHIAGTNADWLPQQATLYAMHYRQSASTDVTAGENNGQTLSSINNVIRIETLGSWAQKDADYKLADTMPPGEDIALILQSDTQGKILGVARVK